MAQRFSGRIASVVVALSVGTGMVALPATAQAGFFEQLFGGGFQPPSAPSYDNLPEQPRSSAPVYRKRPKKQAAENGTGRQKTTDLMHDASLRPGDAVMMKDGLHVYEGESASKHDASDFVALEQADVSSKRREQLVEMDIRRNDPLRGALTPDTLASGRSAAVATPINVGYKITDVRGKSLRYVGP